MHDDADLVHEIPEMEVYTTLPGHGVALHGHTWWCSCPDEGELVDHLLDDGPRRAGRPPT